MVTKIRLATRAAQLSLVLLIAAACSQGPSPEVQAKIDSLSQVAVDNARLMQQVAENSRLVSDIGRELAHVKVPARNLKVTAESPMQASRDSMLQRVRYVTARVQELEPKLQESERRVQALTLLSDSLRGELAATVQSMQGMIDAQKETIESLSMQVDQLTAENAALKDTITHMAADANTVYYVIGTKDQLEQKGIVREAGGARFLFVLWKSGKTLVPARALDATAFTQADRRALDAIPLPTANKEYRIVSRQDLSALATPPSENGTITGAPKIADSARFWANSKYLIIVES
jgi:hypothetical protein